MSKDDSETNTMNVMFDGSDEADDKDDDSIDLKTEKMVKYFEDDYVMFSKFGRYNNNR